MRWRSLSVRQHLAYARVAQGFAGAAAVVVIQAIVRDKFEREDFAKAMSFITLIITIAPFSRTNLRRALSCLVWLAFNF